MNKKKSFHSSQRIRFCACYFGVTEDPLSEQGSTESIDFASTLQNLISAESTEAAGKGISAVRSTDVPLLLRENRKIALIKE